MRKLIQRRAGYNSGYNSGFRAGYNDGYDRGRQVGLSGSSFEGTSIIIPNYNQLNYLRECIESIRQYTPEPYELIIIDNGSDDGSSEYINSLSSVRFQLLPDNRGFAAAVNQGLKLARGTTLLILNNDSVVTTNWLSNLLHCLHSDPHIGIVGPVTNYISGDQLIDTHYMSMAEMQKFARTYNKSEADRWTVTGRLTGFCMLLRRETFISLGYFDEGFEIGNCEDDDYGLRARLMGLKLVIAKDTFIHHYGSISMKSLQGRFDQVYGNNLSFYSNKWSDPHGYLSLEWLENMEGVQLRSIDFYPTCVIIRGMSSTLYWVENGMRYLISGDCGIEVCGIEAIHVSQVDLRSWQLGDEISADQVVQRIQGMQGLDAQESMDIAQSNYAGSTLAEGMLIKALEGNIYQFKGGKLHRFINLQAIATWNLNAYPIVDIDKNRQLYQEGPPIICAPVIRASNI